MRIGSAHAESAIHRLACACQQKATSYCGVDAKFFTCRPMRCIHATDSSRARRLEPRRCSGVAQCSGSAHNGKQRKRGCCVAAKAVRSVVGSPAMGSRYEPSRAVAVACHAQPLRPVTGSHCDHAGLSLPHPSCRRSPASTTRFRARRKSWMPACAGVTDGEALRNASLTPSLPTFVFTPGAASPAAEPQRGPSAGAAMRRTSHSSRPSHMKKPPRHRCRGGCCSNPTRLSAAGRPARRARSPVRYSSPSAGSACYRCAARSRGRPSRRSARSRTAA